MRRKFLFCFVLFGLVFQCSAQQIPFVLKHYSIEDGLGSNQIDKVFKDSRGFLWVATSNGLFHFNGSEFNKIPSKGKSIPGNRIRDIKESSDGVIWIVSVKGSLAQFRYDMPPEQSFVLLEKPECMNSTDEVTAVITLKGNTRLLTKNGKLCTYDESRRDFEVMLNRSNDTLTIKGTLVDSDSSKNELLFFSMKDGFSVLDLDKHEQTKLDLKQFNEIFVSSNNQDGFIFFPVESNETPNANYLWISNHAGDFCKLDWKSMIVSEKHSLPLEFKQYIRAIGQSSDGNVWLAGARGGVINFDITNKSCSSITEPFMLNTEFRLAEAYYFYEDDVRNFWFLTRSGLYQLSPSGNYFSNYSMKDWDADNKEILNITTVHKTNHYSLLIGSESEFLVELDERSNETRVHKLLINGSAAKCSYFFEDSTGNVYVSTLGIQQLDIDNFVATDLQIVADETTVKRFRENSSFRRVIISGQGNNEVWWLSAWGNTGLYSYKPSNRSLKLINPQLILDSTSALTNARGIALDVKGNIWFGTEGKGIFVLQGGNEDKIRNFTSTYYTTSNTSIDYIQDMCTDSRGNVWIATKDGLLSANLDDNGNAHFVEIPVDEAFGQPNFYDLLCDSKDNLWMSAWTGIYRYNILSEKFSEFNRQDGILNPQFASGSDVDRDGNFYFSSFFTFVKFHPDSIPHDIEPPFFYISSLSVNNRDTTELLHSTDFRLPFEENFLTFTLDAVNSSYADDNIFRYKLKGADEEFVMLGKNKTISFMALAPGQYTLFVEAKRESGEWINEPKSFSFTIMPPWYRTWWFGIALILMIGTILYFIYLYRVSQILKLQRVRDNIARDLHDDVGSTLGSISLYADVVRSRRGKNIDADDILEKIGTTSRDTIEKMSDIVWSVKSDNDNMDQLIIRMKSFAAMLLTARGINFIMELPPSLSMIKLNMTQRKNIFMIFKEVLYNAAKYSQCKNIEVTFTKTGKQISMKITDDGIGIIQTKEKGLGGNGLINIKNRAEEINGDINILGENGTTVILNFST